MSITLEELEHRMLRVEYRLGTIEEVLNKVQTAMLNLATQEQLRRINLIRQTEIETLKERITEIQNELALINSEVFK